nr:ATP-binding protein [Rhizobium tubonense]
MQTGQSHAQDHATFATIAKSRVLPVITAVIAAGVFILDSITIRETAVSILYVGVALLAARFLPKRGVVLVALGCMVLAVLSHFIAVQGPLPDVAVSNRLLSLAAIGIAAFLAVQSQSREMVLREQAILLDLSHDTIFVRGMNDVITYWNSGAAELYGWKKEDAVGKITHHLLQTIFPIPLEVIMAELLRTGRWEGELVHTKKDGTQAIVASRWSVQRGEVGDPVAILETNNDITERKRAEEALRETLMQLAHVNRVTTMGQMAASIAHEVNQPIAASLTNAQAALRWLAAQPPDLEEVRQALGRIIDNAGLAGNVIGRIRALIKRVPSHKERFDLHEAILDVIAITRTEALKHGISQQTKLATGQSCVEGDRVQLQQVILNLILNAVEAISSNDEGTRELWISTETDATGGVLVSVRDSGPGLDPKNVDRLFEAFYTTKPSGLGMGLAICRSIIEAHGGRLWGSPTKPRGAVFQFTLLPGRDETVHAERADLRL